MADTNSQNGGFSDSANSSLENVQATMRFLSNMSKDSNNNNTSADIQKQTLLRQVIAN